MTASAAEISLDTNTCIYCGGGSDSRHNRPLLGHWDALAGGDCLAHDRCSEARF